MYSCDERMDLDPAQCDCDIDGLQLSEQQLVTYQVSAHDSAFVSSVTYRTNDGLITTDHPSLPFSTTVQLSKGDTVALRVTGNPGDGTIILTYETNGGPRTADALSSSVSKVWTIDNGSCR